MDDPALLLDILIETLGAAPDAAESATHVVQILADCEFFSFHEGALNAIDALANAHAVGMFAQEHADILGNLFDASNVDHVSQMHQVSVEYVDPDIHGTASDLASMLQDAAHGYTPSDALSPSSADSVITSELNKWRPELWNDLHIHPYDNMPHYEGETASMGAYDAATHTMSFFNSIEELRSTPHHELWHHICATRPEYYNAASKALEQDGGVRMDAIRFMLEYIGKYEDTDLVAQEGQAYIVEQLISRPDIYTDVYPTMYNLLKTLLRPGEA